MKLDDRRYEELKDIVASMFEIFDVRCVPINCFEIADKMGVKLIPYSSFSKRKQQVLKDKSIDGFSTLDSDGVFKIFYNLKDWSIIPEHENEDLSRETRSSLICDGIRDNPIELRHSWCY